MWCRGTRSDRRHEKKGLQSLCLGLKPMVSRACCGVSVPWHSRSDDEACLVQRSAPVVPPSSVESEEIESEPPHLHGPSSERGEKGVGTAIAAGGHVTFSCGSSPITILVTRTLEITVPTVIDGANLITLDGGGTTQILIVNSHQSLSVRQLRFVGGVAPSSMESDGIGGAVAGAWRSAVEVIGCAFEANQAARGGGAVAVWTGSSLVVVESTFVNNVSWYGKAIYSLLSPLTVIDSVFLNNYTILRVASVMAERSVPTVPRRIPTTLWVVKSSSAGHGSRTTRATAVAAAPTSGCTHPTA